MTEQGNGNGRPNVVKAAKQNEPEEIASLEWHLARPQIPYPVRISNRQHALWMTVLICLAVWLPILILEILDHGLTVGHNKTNMPGTSHKEITFTVYLFYIN